MNIADVMKAIHSDDIESLKKLFTSQPVLASERDENGNSPLLMSAYFGRNAMVRVILDQGVRPNVFEACAELERSAKLGLSGMFIPVTPIPGQPYRDPMYNQLWATAADLGVPLLMHLATQRANVPGCPTIGASPARSGMLRCRAETHRPSG